MSHLTPRQADRWAPKRPKPRRSYDESTNEAPQLLEDEPVDIEEEAPAVENEPVEQIEDEAPTED